MPSRPKKPEPAELEKWISDALAVRARPVGVIAEAVSMRDREYMRDVLLVVWYAGKEAGLDRAQQIYVAVSRRSRR